MRTLSKTNPDYHSIRAAESVSFDIPNGIASNKVFALAGGVWGVAVGYYRKFYVTVYSVSVPPYEWQSTESFPVDLLVLHHSPRWLNGYRPSRNWRIWKNGQHLYPSQILPYGKFYNVRQWQPPEFFKARLDTSYIHINVSLKGLKRGDVLCLSGRTIQLGLMDDEGNINCEYNPGIFGTRDCPWFMIETVDIYTDWPDSPVRLDVNNPHAEMKKLGNYLKVQKPTVSLANNETHTPP